VLFQNLPAIVHCFKLVEKKAKSASIGVQPSALNGSCGNILSGVISLIDDWLHWFQLIPFACRICAAEFLLQYFNVPLVNIQNLPVDSCI
jgi:hypothetical protein